MVNSTSLILKVFGRLTPDYEYGLQDYKILILKSFFSVKYQLNLSEFFSLKNFSLGGLADYGPNFYKCFFGSKNVPKIECEIYN